MTHPRRLHSGRHADCNPITTMQKLAKALLIFGIVSIMNTSQEAAAAELAAAKQEPKHFEGKRTFTFEANYLLYLPKGYDAQSSKKWPLMLFLHGAGERGTDITKVATHGPPKHGIQMEDFPFIVVSPQCPDETHWSNELLLSLLDDVMANYPVDPARVYLTGLSMGGYGTWDLGLAYPEKFAAIAPICGGGEAIGVMLTSRAKTQALKTLGVWAFHGGKDPVVPVKESERMVDILKKAGVPDVKLTIYPEAGHDSWTETYKNPEFYKWLLAHHREVKP